MTITKGSDVDVFDGAEKLVLESSRDVFEVTPLSSVFCVTADDGACVRGSGAGRDGGVLSRVSWFDESGRRDGGIGGRRENQTKVAMVSAAECSRNGSGVGFELVFESLECCVGWFANNRGELVWESIRKVFNAWDGGSHRWGGWEGWMSHLEN